MTCDEAREAFTDLYDGILSGPALVALSHHLDGCRACRLEWTAFREAIQALQDLREEEPPPGFAARVMDRIDIPPWWRRAIDALVFPLGIKLPIHAAALVLVGTIGLWFYQRLPELQRAAEVRVPTPAGRFASPQVSAPAPEKLRTEPRQEAAPPSQPPAPLAKPTAPQGGAPAMAKKTSPPAVSDGQGPPQVQQAEGQETPMPQQQPAPSQAGQAVGESAAPRLLRSAPAREESVKAGPAPREEASIPAAGKVAAGPPRGSADRLFSTAATDFAAQKYDAAIEHFRTFLLEYPKDRRAPDARFFLAEAYRAQHQYTQASAEYDSFLREYPDHRRTPDVLYRLGETRLAQGDAKGCEILREALNRYPGARESTSTRETLAAQCP